MSEKAVMSEVYKISVSNETNMLMIWDKRGKELVRLNLVADIPIRVLQEASSNDLLIYFSSIKAWLYSYKDHRVDSIPGIAGHDILFINKELLGAKVNGAWELWKRGASKIYKLEKSEFQFLSHNQFRVFSRNGQQFAQTSSGEALLKEENWSLVYSYPMLDMAVTPSPSIRFDNGIADSTDNTVSIEDFTKQASENDFVIVKIVPGKYMARYKHNGESSFSLWKIVENECVFTQKVEKHACSIKGICAFEVEGFFASVDSGNLIRIWHMVQDSASICQTFIAKELGEANIAEVAYQSKTKRLQLFLEDAIIEYELRLSKYRKDHRNDLIHYIGKKQVAKTRTPIANNDIASINVSKDREEGNSTEETKIGKTKVQETKHTYSTLSQSRLEKKVDIGEEGGHFKEVTSLAYVGVDFGTSRTKICCDYIDKKVILDFEAFRCKHEFEKSYESWTIPSRASISNNKVYYGFDSLEKKEDEESEHYCFLKRNLLFWEPDQEKSKKNVLMAAGYLAYIYNVSKEALASVFHTTGDKLKCQYTMCFPVTQINDNETYRFLLKVLAFSERVYLEGCYQDFDLMGILYEIEWDNIDITQREFTDLIPETIAELVDYHRRLYISERENDRNVGMEPDNNKRWDNKDGLYAFYDFGAGTTDLTVVSLNVSHDIGIMWGSKLGGKIWGSIVIPMGYSDMGDNPREIDIEKHYKNIWKQIEQAGFWHKVWERITGDGALQYFNDIRIIVSGGASECECIAGIFNRIGIYNPDGRDGIEFIKGKELYTLPCPGGWVDAKLPYHRLALAHGLTNEPQVINKNYLLPQEVKDIDVTPPHRSNDHEPNNRFLRK